MLNFNGGIDFDRNQNQSTSEIKATSRQKTREGTWDKEVVLSFPLFEIPVSIRFPFSSD